MFKVSEPIEFGVDAALVTEKFTAPTSPVSEEVVAELCKICLTSTDPADTAQHGRDWWPLSMHWSLAGQTPRRPAAVCRPRTTQDVVAIVNVCRNHDIALTVSAGRSGVCGSAVPLYGGVVLDTTEMNSIVGVDRESGVVEVLPGMFGPDFENLLQSQYNLTVGHYPQSFDISTVGGWVACRGAGQFSTRYGKIEDMVVALEVVLADGNVIITGGAPAAATGPDLTAMFVGSEGTLGVITRVWLRAHPLPTFEMRRAFMFATFADGIAACRDSVRHGATPAVLRLYDAMESKRSHGTDGTQCTLLVLDSGAQQLVEATIGVVEHFATRHHATPGDVGLVEKWMQHRNDTSSLQALSRKGFIVDTMEVSAPWSKLTGIADAVTSSILAVNGARSASVHLSHSYLDGACLYFTFASEVPPEIGLDSQYVGLWDAAQRAALSSGSNVSHHHGIGINRARFLAESLGAAFGVLAAMKKALDPGDIMNPGKLGLPTKRGKVVWP